MKKENGSFGVRVMYCCAVICALFDACNVQRKILHASLTKACIRPAEKTEINWLAALFAFTHKSGTLNLSGHIICGVYALMQVQSLHNTFRSSIMHSDRDAARPLRCLLIHSLMILRYALPSLFRSHPP